MDEMASGTAAVLATMAAPAVLLLANAMLIVSTVQRLQGILAHELQKFRVLGAVGKSAGYAIDKSMQ